MRIGDEQRPVRGNRDVPRESKLRVKRGAAIAAESGGAIARHWSYAAIAIDTQDALQPRVCDENISSRVHGHSARNAPGAVSKSRDLAGSRQPVNASRIGFGEIQVALGVKRQPARRRHAVQ